MKLIKEYQCDSCTPTDDEICECLEIAKAEHCIVRLNWFYSCSGDYSICITEDMTLNECQDELPSVYGV